MLNADALLNAYRQGMFPMAESQNSSDLFWLSPDPRAILPLHNFHAPRRLLKTMRRNLDNGWRITFDQQFSEVMRACAMTRKDTWINQQILDVYHQLFISGYAHSIEVWRHNELVGGLYGVAIGGAFFGESMFSIADDASKIALTALVKNLIAADFVLLDVQFQTEHLKQFGVIEITRADYLQRLENALQRSPAPLRIAQDF